MKFQFKGFTSLLLSAALLILGFSGVILYVTPRGRVANWTGWTMFGLSKQSWQAVHINFALLFLIVAGLHLYLNWPVFWAYIKKKGSLAINLKFESLMALLLAGVVLVGTIVRIQPFSTVVDCNYQVKDYWEHWASEAPSPHAEELSLSRFADNQGLSASDLMKALQENGIVAADASATIEQVAEANNLTPADVYAAIKKRFPEADQRGKGQGKGRGMGQGQGKGRGMGRYSEE
jgi:hypothetical protein